MTRVLGYISIILNAAWALKSPGAGEKPENAFKAPARHRKVLQRLRRALKGLRKLRGCSRRPLGWLSNVAGFLANWGMGGPRKYFHSGACFGGFSGTSSLQLNQTCHQPRLGRPLRVFGKDHRMVPPVLVASNSNPMLTANETIMMYLFMSTSYATVLPVTKGYGLTPCNLLHTPDHHTLHLRRTRPAAPLLPDALFENPAVLLKLVHAKDRSPTAAWLEGSPRCAKPATRGPVPSRHTFRKSKHCRPDSNIIKIRNMQSNYRIAHCICSHFVVQLVHRSLKAYIFSFNQGSPCRTDMLYAISR